MNTSRNRLVRTVDTHGELPAFMTAAGPCAALMRSVDWAATPVGPIQSWPGSLKTTIGTLLHSRHPMFLWWGPDLIQFYNDAYVPSFGLGKHPAAMGQRGADCWQEIWPIISPQIDDVMHRAKASWNEDQLVPIFRNGRIEEVYWTYGYSPVFDDRGHVGGTLVVCTETTTRIVAQRRLQTVGELAARTSVASTFEAALDAAGDVFASAAADVPFALVYMRGDPHGDLVLSRAFGLTPDEAAALHGTFGGRLRELDSLGDPVALPVDISISKSPWPERVAEVFIAPIPVDGRGDRSGVVLYGLSPRLPFDLPYRHHLRSLSAYIGQAHDHIDALRQRRISQERDRFLVTLDDAVRPLLDASAITFAAATALGRHLGVNRCAYATVEDDEDTFLLTGNFTEGVETIVGRYTFTQFGTECLRLMRAGQPYVVEDSETDPHITDVERPSYRATAIRAVICVPMLKAGRFVAAMAVHAKMPRAWRADEIELVQHVASRCWESIERARVAQHLRESERHERNARQDAELQKRLLHSLFMQAPTLIAVLRGPDHVIELANPPVCEAWGRTESELVNKPLLDALPELRHQPFRTLLDEAFRSGRPHHGRDTPALLNRKDGPAETIYFDFVYSPFTNAQGEIEGVFVIASNVTAQVLARNEVDGLRRAAEAANRAKDEFLAMLGHELRNPLSPILTALHLMRMRGDESSERERTVIERQVSHLTRLVDDLLDVSRIARGKVELKEELVEVADVVSKAIEMCSPLLEEGKHTLTVDVPRQGLTVKGDATRLAQVVSNLLNNAGKYTPSGGQITIAARADSTDVVLRVIDTGIGIAPEVLPRIFNLFVQEPQAIDRAHGGLGLGLTIVRNLVERHHGSIAARSAGRGRGSEFVVRLPRAHGAREDAAAQPAATHTRASAPAHALRILVVDDNRDGAELLAAALRAQGHRTAVAHDAPSALRAATKFAPDIAFLDIGLPVMDGYELAERLRQIPGLQNVRLVAITGYGQESDRAKSRAAGFQHHLVKPVDVAALTAVVSP